MNNKLITPKINLSNKTSINGVFIISHGMAEHSGRYEWLINSLNQYGYHVVIYDHLGHGANINDCKGFFSETDGWQKVIENFYNVIDITNKKFPNLKTYVLGHSMGGAISLSALDRRIKADAIIISGTGLIPPLLTTIYKLLIKMQILIFGGKARSKLIDSISIRTFNKKFKPNRTRNDWISSDKNSVDDYTNDPLCGFIVTNQLWYDFINGISMIRHKNYFSNKNKSIPILVMSGEYDSATENSSSSMSLFNLLRKNFNVVKFIKIDNARHEVFTEKTNIRSFAFNQLIEFIK